MGIHGCSSMLVVLAGENVHCIWSLLSLAELVSWSVVGKNEISGLEVLVM